MVVIFSYDLIITDYNTSRSEVENMIFQIVNDFQNCKPLPSCYFIEVIGKLARVKLIKGLKHLSSSLKENKLANLNYVISPFSDKSISDTFGYVGNLPQSEWDCIKKFR